MDIDIDIVRKKTASSSKNSSKESSILSKAFFMAYYDIQKVINNNSKSRPKLNMITKGLSRKQVIVPISNENKT